MVSALAHGCATPGACGEAGAGRDPWAVLAAEQGPTPAAFPGLSARDGDSEGMLVRPRPSLLPPPHLGNAPCRAMGAARVQASCECAKGGRPAPVSPARRWHDE